MAFAARATATKARPKPTKFQRNIRSAANAQKRVETHRTQQRSVLARNITNERGRYENYRTFEQGIRTKQDLALKTKEYRQRRSEQELHKAGQVGRERAYSAVGTATAPARAGANYVLVFLFMVFGLIVFYALVTQPQSTSTFFGRLGNLLAAVSTNAPLFETTGTTSSSSPSSVPSTTTSNTGTSTA